MASSPSTVEPPPLVLVVGDLHLAGGRDPFSGRTDRLENFFADRAFGRFLDFHLPEARVNGPLLVLNGDVLDFLRITRVPRTAFDFDRWRTALAALEYTPVKPLETTLVRKERRYGLRTDDYKTIWKFRQIADGHPEFFAGLRRWVSRGGRVTFIKGGHDLELHWPLLQRAIRAEIAPGNPDAVDFREDHLRLVNLHIEHGHRLEGMSRVTGDPTIYRGEEIRYPFGAFLNKYVINKLETLDPFLDNVRPTSRVLIEAVRKHPLSTLRIAFHGFKALRPVVIRHAFRQSVALLLVLILFVLPVIVVTLAILSFLFESVHVALTSVIGNDPLRRTIGILAAAAPWLAGWVQETIRKIKRSRRKHGLDEYGEAMYRVAAERAEGFRDFFAVVGHTHEADIQFLGRVGESRSWYLNSGSWIARWKDDRPDLLGRVEHTVVRLTLENGEYRQEMLEWRDELGAPRPAVILN